MTRALIAEDEPLLAQGLRAALGEVWPELEVSALAANGLEALEAALAAPPEVAFLDIRMPGLDGLELAAELADRLGERVPQIVFVTAHDEYALEAFERAAADYLLKPVSAERLARCVARLKARLAQPPGVDALVLQLRKILGEEQETRESEPLTVIRAGSGSTVKMIPLEEVCYFRADDKYTSVVTREGEALIRMSLKELLARLPAGRFQRIHRGTVVNMAGVAAARRDDAGRLQLVLRGRKEALPVSRLYADMFRQM
jgi:DNA-binding LytR/AlgR family response regulator